MTATTMKRRLAFLLPLAAATMTAQPTDMATGVSADENPTVEHRDAPAITHEGRTFVLANSTVGETVRTDEFTVAGEKLTQWTELVTVQRLTVAPRANLDGFMSYFRESVVRDGASLEFVKQVKSAAVFAVRFPQSERNEEQVMICLALAEPANPTVLNIVQYAIKPSRHSVPEIAARLTSWRDRFMRQAQASAMAGK